MLKFRGDGLIRERDVNSKHKPHHFEISPQMVNFLNSVASFNISALALLVPQCYRKVCSGFISWLVRIGMHQKSHQISKRDLNLLIIGFFFTVMPGSCSPQRHSTFIQYLSKLVCLALQSMLLWLGVCYYFSLPSNWSNLMEMPFPAFSV